MPKASLRSIFTWRVLVNFFFGISSGAPLLLATGSTLQAWMTDEKVNLKVIGLFALVGLPYIWKFVWAPFMDRYVPPFLGRRRGWIFVTQIGLAITVAAISFTSPSAHPWAVAACAMLIAFVSASQDIVLDAYRREVLTKEELGLGSSIFVNGYRCGMLISGGFALILADHIPWHSVYLVFSAFFLVAALFTLIAPNPLEQVAPPKSMREAIVQPFLEYFRRKGAVEILAFILLYKIGDVMAANMTTPFYLALGFTKTQVGAIVKTFGLAATLTGLFVGGLILLRWKMNRALWLFGILQACSILGFALLSHVGRNDPLLAGVIALDNFASGMGTSAYVAFMASITNKRFTATQLALLTSLMGVPRVVISAATGYIQAALGWTGFFIFCTLSAIPGLLMLLRYHKWQEQPAEPAAA